MGYTGKMPPRKTSERMAHVAGTVAYDVVGIVTNVVIGAVESLLGGVKKGFSDANRAWNETAPPAPAQIAAPAEEAGALAPPKA